MTNEDNYINKVQELEQQLNFYKKEVAKCNNLTLSISNKLNSIYKDAEDRYDNSDMADYEEKQYCSGLMDCVIDLRELINN